MLYMGWRRTPRSNIVDQVDERRLSIRLDGESAKMSELAQSGENCLNRLRVVGLPVRSHQCEPTASGQVHSYENVEGIGISRIAKKPQSTLTFATSEKSCS